MARHRVRGFIISAMIGAGGIGTPRVADAQGAPPTGTLPPEPMPTPTAPTPGAPAPTRAAPLAPTPVAPVVAPPAPALDAWHRDYQRARERLIAGDFETAAGEFRRLALIAPGPYERATADELARLAGEWNRRKLVLVRRQDFAESAAVARARDERTTDEVAVLYLNSVFYGLGTGAYIDVQTEPRSAAGAILPALGLAGAAAGVVYLLDNSGRPLRYGVPQSIVSGMYLGGWEGLVWTLWNQAHTEHRDEWSDKTVATVIWGSATLGVVAGGAIGTAAGSTPGRASFVGSAALWTGLTTGLAVAALHEDDYAQDDAALLGAAIGMNVGIVGGLLGAGPVSPSIARVRFLDLGALAGGLTFGGLYLSLAGDNSDARAAVGVTALGIAGGLGTAWFATNGMEPDRGAEARANGPTFHPTLVPVSGGLGLGLGGTF